MKKTTVKGPWFFREADPASPDPLALALPETDGGPWLQLKVPGDINQALLDHGRLPDPHFDTQARECYWVTSKEWWLFTRFDAPAWRETLDLCLECADGTADLWLNGRFLGTMDNAFRPWIYDITHTVNFSSNLLLVRFRSLDQLLRGPRQTEQGGWKSRRAFLRKPQFNFGWDWALPLPSLGLAGPVELIGDGRACFRECSLKPWKSGRVDFFFEVSPEARAKGYEIVLTVRGHGAKIRERITGKDRGAYTGHISEGHDHSAATFRTHTSIKIPQPRLWWPNGYGEAALYDWEARLLVEGRPAEIRKGRLGLREIEILEEPFRKESGPGFSFGLKVNGVPLFCKGTNLAPMEIWPANAREDQYRFVAEKCHDAHFNMVRVWGGGLYETEFFYNLCDELGLLVWQDFMFASAGYPLPRLRDSIIAEAQYQIQRLRNRPCIALWCGCNEDVYSWRHPEAARETTQADSGDYSVEDREWKVDRLRHDPELYSMLLRGLVGRFGMGVPFVESSPMSCEDAGNMPQSGNSHISSHKYALYQPEGTLKDFRPHFDQVCSFNSEFCIHGPAAASSIRKFMAPENHWPPNAAWDFHIQRGHMNMTYHDQIFRIATPLFGPMKDLPAFVKYGQALHAEEMRCEFESARRNRPDCGGTMFWMFNDCWPTSNWSVIDYYRTPKPAYYAAKRSCAPHLPIILERKGIIEFYMSNESPTAARAEWIWGAETLDGKRFRSKRRRFTVPANGLIRVDAVQKAGAPLPLNTFWFIRAEVNGRPLFPVTYFPYGWKEVPWPLPLITVTKTPWLKSKGRYFMDLTVESDSFVRLAHFRIPDSRVDFWFSDNYFDLPAGHVHKIRLEAQNPIRPDDIETGHWLTEWS